jgi:molybdenum cofactor biosynthesis enzyme MoaA
MVRNVISEKDYLTIAGADWPSYNDYLIGKISQFVLDEIDQKIKPLAPFIPISPTYQQEKDPNVSYQYTLRSMPRGANSKPINHDCNHPFKIVEIDMWTNCNLCSCTGWLPRPVGKITDFARLEDIWNNPKALEIQQDVVSKKFTWCAVEHCGIKYHDNFSLHHQLVFAIDDSCNLQCPSCRREKRLYTSGPLYEEKLRAIEHAVKLLNEFDQPINILFNCSGDPLASPLSRPFLQSYKGNNKQTFTLFTNGLLIKKLLPTTTIFERITRYQISIDAGSEEVYEKVRIGGSWKILLENLDFLRDRGLSNLVVLIFTVQKNNFRDILNFENLCKIYGFKGLLTQLDDWGTWINKTVDTPDAWTLQFGTFMDNNVLNSAHKDYNECVAIIKNIKFDQVECTPRLLELINNQ